MDYALLYMAPRLNGFEKIGAGNPKAKKRLPVQEPLCSNFCSDQPRWNVAFPQLLNQRRFVEARGHSGGVGIVDINGADGRRRECANDLPIR